MSLLTRLKSWIGPSSPQANNLPGNWIEYMTGSGAYAGKTMTEAGVMNISAVYCAVNLISDSIKSMPLILYRRDDDGKTRDEGHPAHYVAKRRPNPYTTPSRFKKQLQLWSLLWGNGYAEIERRNGGEPVALWLIHPNRVKPEVEKSGYVRWKVANDSGTFTYIEDINMLHIMGPSSDGVTGMSIVSRARDSFGLAAAAELYGRRFFSNSAIPSGVIEHPGPLKDLARENLRRSWEKMHSGENQGKVAILEEGMKFQNIGMPSKDAQFLETRQFQVVEIARWFNVPPHKLKDLERATFSNIEEQNIEYVQDCIMPLAIDFEEECNRKLLSEDEQETYFFEFLADGLLRANIATRYAAYAVARQWGWMSANDILRKENMNTLEGDQGDIYLVPMNMVPADRVDDVIDKQTATDNASTFTPQTPEPPPDDGNGEDEDESPDANKPDVPKIAQAFAPVFADVYGRMLTKESKAAERAAKNEATFGAWIDRFYADHELLVRDALIPACEACAAAVMAASGMDLTPEQIADSTRALAQIHIRQSKHALKTNANAAADDSWQARSGDLANLSINEFVSMVTL